MPRRTTLFADNYFYHLYNRGVEKRVTFQDDRDYLHFLKILSYYQYLSPKPSYSHATVEQFKEVESSPKIVEIISYCLMPNHYHLLIKQLQDGGIIEFMRKVGNEHTRYFNTRHTRVGPLFQGAYKSVSIESDEQLVHVSRYIHLNPLVSGITKDLRSYPWSSYPDYIEVREGKLTNKQEILGFFKNPQEYEKFVLDQYSYALDLERIKHQLLDGED